VRYTARGALVAEREAISELEAQTPARKKGLRNRLRGPAAGWRAHLKARPPAGYPEADNPGAAKLDRSSCFDQALANSARFNDFPDVRGFGGVPVKSGSQ
jgi:hypothetical protein